MHPLIKSRQSELNALCRRYHVRRLDLFGSAAAGEFDPETSDLDFLVEFESMEPVPYKRAFFGLLSGLKELFDRPVDLLVSGTIENPYIRRNIDANRKQLYAAA